MSHYAPHAPGLRPDGLRYDTNRVRQAGARDVPAIARIHAEREGGDPTEAELRIRAEIEGTATGRPWRVFVAEADGSVVAYGRARCLTHAEDDLPEALPEGWYLTGVVVAAPFRRRGIGAALTEARLRWLRRRAEAVHYVANLANAASIDLHGRYGFEEITRDFEYPRAGLRRGAGAAFRLRFG